MCVWCGVWDTGVYFQNAFTPLTTQMLGTVLFHCCFLGFFFLSRPCASPLRAFLCLVSAFAAVASLSFFFFPSPIYIYDYPLRVFIVGEDLNPSPSLCPSLIRCQSQVGFPRFKPLPPLLCGEPRDQCRAGVWGGARDQCRAGVCGGARDQCRAGALGSCLGVCYFPAGGSSGFVVVSPGCLALGRVAISLDSSFWDCVSFISARSLSRCAAGFSLMLSLIPAFFFLGDPPFPLT